jgi:hypothetical protein
VISAGVQDLRKAGFRRRLEGVAVPELRCEPIELVSVACSLALLNLGYQYEPTHTDSQVVKLEPMTHAFSCWKGINDEGKKAFGRLFASSRTLRVSTRACVCIM